MIRGTAADHPFVPDAVYEFTSPSALVRWWLGTGRASVAQVRAIDYAKDSEPRDFWSMEKLLMKFAMVTRTTMDLTAREYAILRLAYESELSDSRIAERLGATRRTVARQRRAALQSIRRPAEAWGLLAPEAI
jgi:DNA-binding CsgD family transcriptional regulator